LQQYHPTCFLFTLAPAEATSPDDQLYYQATEMSTEQSRIALADVVELLEAAEAKVGVKKRTGAWKGGLACFAGNRMQRTSA
jgi:hypothetical protein